MQIHFFLRIPSIKPIGSLYGTPAKIVLGQTKVGDHAQ